MLLSSYILFPLLLIHEILAKKNEDQLWSLHWMLTRLTSFPMEVVERKQSEDLTEYRKKAMDAMTLVHEAEDVTDSFLNTVRSRNSSLPGTAQEFQSQIKGMMEKLKGLHVWFHEFTKSSTCGTSSSSSSKRGPPIDDKLVVPEDEVKRMIDLLLLKEDDQEDTQRRRSVIPIVGPGGIGKTTLARQVYNHPTVVRHFSCRSWIYVSGDYKLEELLHDIIEQIKPITAAPTAAPAAAAAAAAAYDERKEITSLKGLAFQTYKLLKTTPNSRYLIVFDNVCKTQFWADIHMLFPNTKPNSAGGGGSRIIFTTRHDEVALHARPSRPPFYLRSLTKEESWELFSERVGLVEDESNQNRLQWQEWVDACGGQPHTIVALAAEYINHSPDDQPSMMKDDDDKKDEDVRCKIPPPGIRELIYNNLPHHLKACLAYLDIVKQGSYSFFDFKGLIVAEGLVKTPLAAAAAAAEHLEDIAEEYLKELIRRNLIEVKSRSFDGRIKEISMLDFCRSEVAAAASKMKFLQPDLGTGFYECFFSDPPPPSTLKERSFFNWNLYQHSPRSITVPYLKRIFHDLASLRVLDLNLKFDYTPYQTNLIHLRYLRLDAESIESRKTSLPKVLNLLCNLQFLKAKGYNYGRLQFWKMPQLRHISCDFKLSPFINDDEKISDRSIVLKNLQTLKGLDAQSCGRREDIWSMMPNLITLHIEFSQRLGDNLPSLERLRKLQLQDWDILNYHEYNLDIFAPNITHLTLIRTELEMRSRTLRALRKLHNLCVLKLKYRSIKNETDLDFGSDGDGNGDVFRQLKFLKIKDLFLPQSFSSNPLKKWNLSKGVMPCLQMLAIINCKRLEGLPSAALELIPTLQELVVDTSNDRVLADARLIQERVGKDRLKLLIQ